MRIDYHMHFEYGSYDLAWVQGFFDAARKRGVNEIGIAEHSHGFVEFKDLYQEEMILDETPIGQYQQQWLDTNKFRYSLSDYFNFMTDLKKRGYPVKIGLEVCNFRNHAAVRNILDQYEFDYIIGSIHFLKGWGFDFEKIKFVWKEHPLKDIYEWYTEAITDLCASGIYDILGHPFNLRLFKNFPDFDVQPFLDRVATALREANMAIDINTGTLYRYPVEEISPYPAFMKTANRYGLPIITSSDAHKPADCGRYISKAEEYAQSFGFDEILVFSNGKAIPHKMKTDQKKAAAV